jgi:chromate reductase, NAD(P)H dehydrogenase (quinone)
MVIKESENINIFSFAGSLRKGSYNRMLLKAACALSPENVRIETFDLEGIGLFNQDLENNPNDKLKMFKEKIKTADGLLIVTPEYNYSVPGVLKNAIDAVSRPYGTNPFSEKPVGIMGASIGMIGTARAQYHLRQSMVFLDAYVMNKPEIMVSFAEKKFDLTGSIIDEMTRQKVKEFMDALAGWVIKFRCT